MQLRLSTQALDGSLTRSKLVSDFLNGTDLNLTNGNNNATLTGVANPINPFDVANKQYVDGLIDASLKAPEAYDASVNLYPTTYGGEAIRSGDSFRITASGTMGTRKVNIEDLLIAIIDAPSGDADWMVAESNRDQATETILGLSKIATQVLTDAGVNDSDYITPLKLSTYIDNIGLEPITASNGLTKTSGLIELGGTLTKNTAIEGGTFFFDITSTRNRLMSNSVGGGLNYVMVSESMIELRNDPDGSGLVGSTLVMDPLMGTTYYANGPEDVLKYGGDYSANYGDRSLVDKGYVLSVISGLDTISEELTVANNTSVTLVGANSGSMLKRVFQNGNKLVSTEFTVTDNAGVITITENGTCDFSNGDVIEVEYIA